MRVCVGGGVFICLRDVIPCRGMHHLTLCFLRGHLMFSECVVSCCSIKWWTSCSARGGLTSTRGTDTVYV